jgi:hypothetical protein
MRFLKLEQIIVFIFFTLLTVFAIYHWFSNGSFLYYWDTMYPLDVKFATQSFFYSWNPLNFPGYTGNGWSWFAYSFSIAFMLKIFNSPSYAQEVLYFLFMFLSLFNFYYFLKYLNSIIFGKKNNKFILSIITFLFATLYTFNLYTFYYSYFMFNPQIYIYSFLPLNFLALLKIYPLHRGKDQKINYSFWIIVFFISLFLMTPGFTTYVFLAQYLFIIFLYLFLSFFSSEQKLFSKSTLDKLLFFALVLIFQWWWFFPSILGFRDLYDSQSSLGTTVYFDAGSVRSNLLNSFRLFGSPMMNNNPFSWDHFYNSNLIFTFPIFIFLFSIIFLMIKIKKIAHKKLVLFFMTILLGSLFIVKLGNPPFAWITKYAFEHVAFFGAFRDAWHKAGLFYLFSFFTLSFVGFTLLIKSLQEIKKRIIALLLIGVLFLATIVTTAPFFLFSYDNIKKINFEYENKTYTLSAKTKIPQEYYDLKNVLENNCEGTTTIVIPRSSMISSAVWEKYGTSYVGQDLLTRFMNCNVISSQLLNNGPDSFNFSPYLLLEKNDFPSFKKFLSQNQIGLILLRKDNIPYYYTNYTFLSDATPEYVFSYISKDSDFENIYENKFFTLYSFKKAKNASYGFAIPLDTVFTNSSLNNGDDYLILSKQISSSSGSIIINTSDDLKNFRDKLNYFAPVAECVGCVRVMIDPTEENISFKEKIKPLFLPVLSLIRGEKMISEDEKISYSIIASNKTFMSLITKLKREDFSPIETLAKSYLKELFETRKLIENYKGVYLDENNKLIEYKNFISGQNSFLVSYMSSNKIKDGQVLTVLYGVLLSQNNELNFIKNNIWETDTENKKYNARLNIPEKGEYSCYAETIDQDVTIKKISIGSTKENLKEVPFISPIKLSLENNSYFVSVNYDSKKILDVDRLNISNEQEFDLGKLSDGRYDISFNFESSSSGKLLLIISNKKLYSNDLVEKNLDKLTKSFLYTELIDSEKNSKYGRPISISAFANKNYYLYFINLNGNSNNSTDSINLFSLKIQKGIENNGIKFYCTMKFTNDKKISNKINVEKLSPTKYKVILSKDYTGFLTFNQTFSADWIAYSVVNGKKHIYSHFKNAYANGWYIDDYENKPVLVEFTRQSLIEKNGLITFIVLIIFAYIYLRFKNGKKI